MAIVLKSFGLEGAVLDSDGRRRLPSGTDRKLSPAVRVGLLVTNIFKLRFYCGDLMVCGLLSICDEQRVALRVCPFAVQQGLQRLQQERAQMGGADFTVGGSRMYQSLQVPRLQSPEGHR